MQCAPEPFNEGWMRREVDAQDMCCRGEAPHPHSQATIVTEVFMVSHLFGGDLGYSKGGKHTHTTSLPRTSVWIPWLAQPASAVNFCQRASNRKEESSTRISGHMLNLRQAFMGGASSGWLWNLGRCTPEPKRGEREY